MVDELRVADWASFVGQEALKSRLDVHITAAVKQDRTLESILLVGPPGFGKTSLASIIGGRLSVDVTEYTMPLEERIMVQVVTRTSGVLLLDELHRASARQQEQLLPLLEFGYVQDRRGHRYPALDLTVIGATTEPEKVITPLYDRFDIKPDFDDYSDEEMGAIVAGMAIRSGVVMEHEMAEELGRATGGTPRRARQFVLATRDLLASGADAAAEDVLALCRVDPSGLTQQHKQYLAAIEKLGGVAGLRTLQTVLRLGEPVVRELERLLVKQELVTYTDRGRELTPQGYRKAA